MKKVNYVLKIVGNEQMEVSELSRARIKIGFTRNVHLIKNNLLVNCYKDSYKLFLRKFLIFFLIILVKKYIFTFIT